MGLFLQIRFDLGSPPLADRRGHARASTGARARSPGGVSCGCPPPARPLMRVCPCRLVRLGGVLARGRQGVQTSARPVLPRRNLRVLPSARQQRPVLETSERPVQMAVCRQRAVPCGLRQMLREFVAMERASQRRPETMPVRFAGHAPRPTSPGGSWLRRPHQTSHECDHLRCRCARRLLHPAETVDGPVLASTLDEEVRIVRSRRYWHLVSFVRLNVRFVDSDHSDSG